jgi:hypothetical protein
MRDHTTRRAMPVEQSILWKPFQDSHYVVASLQPGDGGRKRIFVRQQVVARIEGLVRAHGRRTIGLLLGQSYQCPVTGADYVIIDSVVEHAAVIDDNGIAPAIAKALAEHSAEQRPHLLRLNEPPSPVVGWYRGVPTVEAKPSLTTAGVHASLFARPWQTTLIVGEGTNASSGAFFLRDTVNSRWFYAPFYELLSHAPTPGQAKATLINWPKQYLTAESVVAAAREVTPLVESDARPKKTYERPWLRRSPTKEGGAQRAPSEPVPFAPPSPHDNAPPPVAAGSPDREVVPTGEPSDVPVPNTGMTERSRLDTSATDRPVARAVHSAADIARVGRERSRSRRAGSGEKLSIVDDRDQRTTAPPSHGIVGDDEDTTLGDDPGRYIELARTEGFFIAGRFDTTGEMGRSETVWVLNEPYSGMLLAVVATEDELVDATLHYNLQTDDAGLAATPFPEHRDPESKTIYVRESCGDSLRARCRRLRATNALLREWKVTPPIWFLTPAEWESIPPSDPQMDREGRAATDLNKARIAELPPGGQSQFHLTDGDEASA